MNSSTRFFLYSKDRGGVSNLSSFLLVSYILKFDGFFPSSASGGSKPNLADLAVFGVLRPIRYLRAGRDMVEHTRIGEWYSRMETAVGESSRIKA